MTAAVQENVHYADIAADTDPFPLLGGRYAVSVVGSDFGTVSLQMQGPDGSTFLDLLKPFNNAGTETDLVIGAFAAAGVKVFDLAPGQYKVVVDSATAVYVDITSVPQA